MKDDDDTGASDSPSGVVTGGGSGGGGGARKKVPLGHGCSLMAWIQLCKEEGMRMSGVSQPVRVTVDELAQHDGSDGGDVWIAIRGKVYNVSPYLRFHPGGADELMRGAGKDATRLFDFKHKWVNVQNMLRTCVVGYLG